MLHQIKQYFTPNAKNLTPNISNFTINHKEITPNAKIFTLNI